METVRSFFIGMVFLGLQMSIAQTSDIRLDGNVRVKFDRQELTLEVTRIENYEDGGKSGSLKLAVYFSKDYYGGTGTLSGTKAMEVDIDRIRGGYYYQNYEFTRSWLSRPKDGTYHLVVAVLEYDGRADRYYIVSSVTLNPTMSVDYGW